MGFIKLIGFRGGAAIILALTLVGVWIAWGVDSKNLNARIKKLTEDYATLYAQAQTVRLNLADLTGNEKLQWKDVNYQLTLLGGDRDKWRNLARTQGDQIKIMYDRQRTYRERAEAAEQVAAKLRAQRNSARKVLLDASSSPAKKKDAETLYWEAMRLTDKIREMGF